MGVEEKNKKTEQTTKPPLAQNGSSGSQTQRAVLPWFSISILPAGFTRSLTPGHHWQGMSEGGKTAGRVIKPQRVAVFRQTLPVPRRGLFHLSLANNFPYLSIPD